MSMGTFIEKNAPGKSPKIEIFIVLILHPPVHVLVGIENQTKMHDMQQQSQS